MNKIQKITVAAVVLIMVAALALVFAPIGQDTLSYDFNSGMMYRTQSYFGGLWKNESAMPSYLGSQMIRLGFEGKFPPLRQVVKAAPIILMNKTTYMAMPPAMQVKMMKMNFGINSAPRLSPEAVLTFRDEFLNEFGTPEIVEAAKQQGEARGGYIPDAFWAREGWGDLP